MSQITRLLIVFLGFFSCVAQAFIYEVVVLKRWSEKCGAEQYFIGLSDFHDKKNDVNTGQLSCIEQFLDKQNKATTKVIVEDLSTARDGGQGCCGQFQINSRGGILGGLARSCHQKGLHVDNIEYRYCRVASLGPVINNLEQRAHEFPSACTVKVSDIAHEIHNALEEIVNHTGSEAFASCRDNAVQEIQPQMRQLSLSRDATNSVAEYVHHNSQEHTRLDFLKLLLTFDGALLDLKLAHSVATTHDCTKIIAIAGGSHIRRVKQMLLEIGYEVVHETPVQFKREYDLQRCKGSCIVNGLFCVRPEPIDLSILKRFL